jgi:hypothetical protein
MDESHRSDLTARIPGFVDRAEAMIARKVRAIEMIDSVTLTDADRVIADSPIYTLPSDFLEDRNVVTDDRSLRKVSRDSLLSTNSSGLVQVYHMRSDPDAYLMEFRAVPGTDAEIEVEYFARPAALTDDSDTNRLLAAHESVYLYAALFHLYTWTQDLELAQAAVDTFKDAADTLNELAGRFTGGTNEKPKQNLGHFRIATGY